MKMKSADRLMHAAVAENIFPGAHLLVSHAGNIVFDKAYGRANIYTGEAVTRDTVFDLASLTKPLATTLAVMILTQEGRICLDQTLAAIIPDFAASSKADIQIRHLLDHTSGLPDYRPYYQTISRFPFDRRKPALKNLILAESLMSAIGEKTRYSDIGFMILEWVIEKVAGLSLNDFVRARIYDPLGIQNLFFIGHDRCIIEKSYAATEFCPWRRMLLIGRVHDDNAYVLGGVAGHAGLFGTAGSVHVILHELLKNFHGDPSKQLFQPKLVRLFLQKSPGSDRALGFDMPSRAGSSSGKFFTPDATVGHLGFTGTSFWMDLDKQIILILLTNRVHPSRSNEQIRAFRPLIHDEVMKQFQ
ncbi:MAG: serine hydrolase [Desulfobacterales bacterium CG23_combo_of_CG06-09_8_20_14_all_51_8]|nr:MAG: serine hydrolase [Desulfobacterales bacterium CG23_combo_of_CG06-09_8_20_14_all_51_8]